MLKKILVFCAAIIMTALFVKCTSSDDIILGEQSVPVNSVYTFANGTSMSISSVSPYTAVTRGGGLSGIYKLDDYTVHEYSKSLPAITDAEKTAIFEYLEKKPEGSDTYDGQLFYIQYVGQAEHKWDAVDGNGQTQTYSNVGNMNSIQFNGEHKADYNATGGSDAICFGKLTDLAFDSNDDTVNKTYHNFKFFEYNGNTYVGLDFEMHKNDGQQANPAGTNIDKDGVYNDYVIKLTPVTTPNSETSEDKVTITIPTEIQRKWFLDADDFAIRENGVYKTDTVHVSNGIKLNNIELTEANLTVTVNNVNQLVDATIDYTYEVYLWFKDESWKAMSDTEKAKWLAIDPKGDGKGQGTDISDLCTVQAPVGYTVKKNVYLGTSGNNGDTHYIKVSIHIKKDNE